MSVAIIGAGGFVGTRLIESLVLDGRTGVRPIVRSYRNMAGLCRFGAAVDVQRADAEKTASLTAALRGMDTAVNVTTGPPAGIVRSTAAIHEACVSAGVKRLVHLSSAVVYGDVPVPIDDDHPPLKKHWMPYARAKAASEVWLRQRLDDPRLDVVVLRPGIVWGVRSPHTMDIARSLAGKQTFLVGEGRGIFNGVYIDNLVACIRAACEYAGQAAGFYNVGDREAVTWLEFYRALGVPLGCDPTRLPIVSEKRFPPSIGATIDTVQSLSLVNELYHRLKIYIPDGAKAAIRARLEGPYSYDRRAVNYASKASVARELWYLQRVKHKLAVDKFAGKFAFETPVSFAEGIARTLSWLATLGWLAPSSAVQRSAG